MSIDRSCVPQSGAVAPTGAIAGNANDEDVSRVEPHYEWISMPDEVQIYESVMVDHEGTPTTGLLHGVRYAKDNRLLPRGFDKSRRRPTSRCPAALLPIPTSAPTQRFARYYDATAHGSSLVIARAAATVE